MAYSLDKGFRREAASIDEDLSSPLLDEGPGQGPGIGGAEIERHVAIGHELGGTYTLTFDGSTTAPLPHNATKQDLKLALEGLPSIDEVDVRGEFAEHGGSWFAVTFTSDLNSGDLPAIVADGTMLTGKGADVVVCVDGDRSGVCSGAESVAGSRLGGTFTIANGANLAEVVTVEHDASEATIKAALEGVGFLVAAVSQSLPDRNGGYSWIILLDTTRSASGVVIVAGDGLTGSGAAVSASPLLPLKGETKRVRVMSLAGAAKGAFAVKVNGVRTEVIFAGGAPCAESATSLAHALELSPVVAQVAVSGATDGGNGCWFDVTFRSTFADRIDLVLSSVEGSQGNFHSDPAMAMDEDRHTDLFSKGHDDKTSHHVPVRRSAHTGSVSRDLKDLSVTFEQATRANMIPRGHAELLSSTDGRSTTEHNDHGGFDSARVVSKSRSSGGDDWSGKIRDTRQLASACSFTKDGAWNDIGSDCDLSDQIVVGNGEVLRIRGVGGGKPVIKAGDEKRHFLVESGGILELEAVQLVGYGNDFSGEGGAIYNEGEANFVDCVVKGNKVVRLFSSGLVEPP